MSKLEEDRAEGPREQEDNKSAAGAKGPMKWRKQVSRRLYMGGRIGLASNLHVVKGFEGAFVRAKRNRTTLDKLLKLAKQAARNSYSPYSKFRVGAALELTNGEIVTGTNVENVSYGLTICAERAALVRAVSQFGPKIRIAAMAVTNLNGLASPPCGACRQVLAEFALPEAPVMFPTADGIRTMTMRDLLPLGREMKLGKTGNKRKRDRGTKKAH